MLDTLKATALIIVFIAVLATFAMAVEWWDYTWKAAVEPTRANIYRAKLGPSHCFSGYYWHWRENGCRLI